MNNKSMLCILSLIINKIGKRIKLIQIVIDCIIIKLNLSHLCYLYSILQTNGPFLHVLHIRSVDYYKSRTRATIITIGSFDLKTQIFKTSSAELQNIHSLTFYI